MNLARDKVGLVVVLIAVVGGILPPLAYWQFVGQTPTVSAEELPFRESSSLDQSTAVITGFVIKPAYMVLALGIVLVLWRQRSPDLAALRWAMLAFFLGEAFCAGNYLVCEDQSNLMEYLHSYGMVLSFGLTTYAVLEGLDLRVVKFSDRDARCAAVGLCRRCFKHADAPCGLKRTFLLVVPATMLFALVPLGAELTPVSYNTRILGTFYNCSHQVVYQIYEARYLPVAALVLLAASLASLAFNRDGSVRWSKVFFAAGAGALGFSLFRLVFLHVFRDNLIWFAAWEELTELLFVTALAIVLWIFRAGCFVSTDHCATGA